MIKQEQKQQASLNARSEKIQKSAGPTIYWSSPTNIMHILWDSAKQNSHIQVQLFTFLQILFWVGPSDLRETTTRATVGS